MIQIEGKYYAIDIDKIMKWVSETPNTEKNINTITTMSYPIANDEEDNEIVEKEITENKSSLNDTMNNVRYDLLRNLFNVLFTTITNDLGQVLNCNLDSLTMSQKIIFNTLLHKKIIIELENESYE